MKIFSKKVYKKFPFLKTSCIFVLSNYNSKPKQLNTMKTVPTMGSAKDLCSRKLKELSSFVTPKDKVRARQQLHYARVTIDKYLDGKVNKIDVAMDLIDFFQPIVDQRINRLQTKVA